MKVGGNTGFKTSLTFWQMKSRSASRPCPNAQRFRTLFDPIDDAYTSIPDAIETAAMTIPALHPLLSKASLDRTAW